MLIHNAVKKYMALIDDEKEVLGITNDEEISGDYLYLNAGDTKRHCVNFCHRSYLFEYVTLF